MMRVKNITKRFGDHTVLRGVSIDVHDGETLVLLGKSGSGKSVLLKMLIGLIKPDSGSILIDDHDVTTMNYRELREYRKQFGFVFQEAALFDSLTVEQNLALALRQRGVTQEQVIREQVRNALDRVDLENIEHQSPSTLSGGMRKRVGLARAIVVKPQYMLYDEPTTGLDVSTAEDINQLILNLHSRLGITSVLVTHDVRGAVRLADRLAILHDGLILTVGTLEEIKKTNDPEVRNFIKDLP